MKIFAWIAQIIVAVIYLQTMYFKFTYAPETQIIFGDLGGRPAATLAGMAELTAAILLLIPRRYIFSANAVGALLSLMVIGGAIMTHLLFVGIEIQDDGGLLFYMAVLIAILSAIVLIIRRDELPWYPSATRRRTADHRV